MLQSAYKKYSALLDLFVICTCCYILYWKRISSHIIGSRSGIVL